MLEGLRREDLFTVVFEQVFTDTARFADVLLPATTFVENYDIARGYGPISLQVVRPAIEPMGEARPNPAVFSELSERLGIGAAEEETDTLIRIGAELPPAIGSELLERGAATPPFGGRPIQFVDVFPLTPDRKIDLFPDALEAQAPAGLYAFQPDPATAEYPLALISPASEKTVSSTLGELRERPGMLPDAPGRRRRTRPRHRRSRAHLQRPRRGALPRRRHAERPARHRQPVEGPVAQEHLQRIDVERVIARHVDGSRRRSVLQRCARAGDVVGKALTSAGVGNGVSPQCRG